MLMSLAMGGTSYRPSPVGFLQKEGGHPVQLTGSTPGAGVIPRSAGRGLGEDLGRPQLLVIAPPCHRRASRPRRNQEQVPSSSPPMDPQPHTGSPSWAVLRRKGGPRRPPVLTTAPARRLEGAAFWAGSGRRLVKRAGGCPAHDLVGELDARFQGKVTREAAQEALGRPLSKASAWAVSASTVTAAPRGCSGGAGSCPCPDHPCLAPSGGEVDPGLGQVVGPGS